MQVTRVTTAEELCSLATCWSCLTRGNPFRSSQWLATWWKHYGEGRELYVLTVSDATGSLVGLLPLHLTRHSTGARLLQFLGTGEVCTDYLTVLVTHEHADVVVDELASWLIEAAYGTHGKEHRWDLMELEGVLASDPAVSRLVGTLAEEGCGVHRRPGLNCWRLPLPPTWDELTARYGKSQGRRIRRLARDVFDNQRAVLQTVECGSDLPAALRILVELHQKRWRSLGQPGCFASDKFGAFIHEVAGKLLDNGNLDLCWLELDGRPVAVEFNLANSDSTYVYQGGIDPQLLQVSPGHLMTMALIRRAIERSQTTYDWMRGDEPYKAEWGARPHATLRFRISANRLGPQLRQGFWVAGLTAKNWVKSGMTLTGMH